MRCSAGLSAALDQAWLSLLNLSLALAFIRWGSKLDYGYYAMLQTPMLLAQGALNALVLSPLATRLPAAAEHERAALRAFALRAIGWLSAVAALLGALLLAAAGALWLDWVDATAAGAFGLAMAGLLLRDGVRAQAYAEGQAPRALRGDLLYGGLLLSGLLGLILAERVALVPVMMAGAVAGLAPLLMGWRRSATEATPGAEWREFWRLGRWALPGVAVTWVTLSAYPLVAGAVLGAGAAADISAARLFLMPAALGLVAWSNLFRPRFSRLFADGQRGEMARISRRSMALGGLALAVYAGLILAAYPWLSRLLGADYGELRLLVLAWAVYFMLAQLRGVFSASLMVSEAGYRQLHHMGWCAMLLCLAGLALLAPHGILWIVATLCAVELLQVCWTGHLARRLWRATA